MDFIIQLDIQLLLLINGLQNRFLDSLALGINLITEAALLWLFMVLMIFLLDKTEKKRKIFLVLFSLLINSWLINVPLKIVLFCRARPFEVVEGIKLLAETEGIFAETAGGVTIATLKRLVDKGFISRHDRTVALVTGNGLKTQEAVVDAVGTPIRIRPNLGELKEVVDLTSL